MSLLLLLSTLTWTVDAHLCMGRTMDVAFFTKADSCGMEAMVVDGLENHCCANETVVIVGQDDLQGASFNADLQQQPIFIGNTTLQTTFKRSEIRSIVRNGYPPPEELRIIDRNILYETFRI